MKTKRMLDFLGKLKLNNDRNWFHDNRQSFEQAKEDFEFFVTLLLQKLQQMDKALLALGAKDCIFRIHRDIRFSPDKTPYKTHFGAYIAKDGKKSSFAGYYIQIEPHNSFIAGGIYRPPSDVLRRIRNEIYLNVGEFKSIISRAEFISHFGVITGDRLLAAPQGFEKDFPDIDLLKFKSYTVIKPVTDQQVLQEDFLPYLSREFKVIQPFIQFLNHGIDPENP